MISRREGEHRRAAGRAGAVLAGAGFVCVGVALSANVWIVCPAPAYNVWLLAVVACEWSLWLGLLALVGVGIGYAARRRGASARSWRATFGVGALAIGCAVYPLVGGMIAAREHGVRLSAVEYVFGARRRSAPPEFTTHTFATFGDVDLRLDVYLPPAGVERTGAGVVVVHGGSWNAGGRGDFPVWNGWLARQGYAVFDIDYRLAPQPNWREAHADVRRAVTWIKDHHAEFAVDPERLALLGRSAGAHLALLAAYTAAAEADAAPGADAARDANDARVRAAIAFYAPTDLLWAYDHPANEAVIDGPGTLRRVLGGDPHASSAMRERFRLWSPIEHVTPRAPPTLLAHGGRDQLVRSINMEFLADRLRTSGVEHEAVLISYAQHGFDYNPHGWGSQVTRAVLSKFLARHLRAAHRRVD